jgi:hypothetical protein
MSDEQKIIQVAEKLLKLEQDLTAPGSKHSDEKRIEELIKFLSSQDF